MTGLDPSPLRLGAFAGINPRPVREAHPTKITFAPFALFAAKSLLLSFSLLAIEPFDEAAGLDLAQQTAIDEFLWVHAAHPWIGFGDLG